MTFLGGQCSALVTQWLLDLGIQYWLNYWHILISKGTSGFSSNTLLIRIEYFYQFKYICNTK